MNMPTDSNPNQFALANNNGQPVIRFEDVQVCYRIPQEGFSGIKEFAIRLFQRRMQAKEFWALRGTSFTVNQGEVFGIIGRNGAGKSTMLKVMARVLQPSKGRVVMTGRIAPLLELGGGFHPELTGRENVYLNMALLGFNRPETDALFDSIVDFSEIAVFIDQPLRTYSTGMVARLGFSVATCARPDILLVDEVLSVGDAQFQQKCLDRMTSFQQAGTTIVIVSHSMHTIQTFCDRALWLNNGKIEAMGETGEVIDRYIYQETTGYTADAESTAQQEYTQLDPERQVYPTQRIFDPTAGTAAAWVGFSTHTPGSTGILFHTEDSRFVVYSQAVMDVNTGGKTFQITARAGGNRRASAAQARPDSTTAEFQEGFPEVVYQHPYQSTNLEQWLHVALTWDGFPQGQLRFYVNGRLAAEFAYRPEHNDDQPLPRQLAIGMRPLNWPGERVRQPDGTFVDLRPGSTMSVSDAGIELRDIRLYRKPLQAEKIQALYSQGLPLLPEVNFLSRH
jgi:ABC-type polysaccharide/polyol phosphate transport system ATPase subunit